MIPRVNRQSAGYFAVQFFDATDKFGAAYDETNLPIMHGARYTWVQNEAGQIVMQTVDGTDGPVGGVLVLPPKAPRTVAQIAFGPVPVKITSASPLKATPVKTGNGSGWTVATDLDEFAVFTSDGSSPAVGTFGLALVGSELTAQTPLFFEGGGAGVKTYKVTAVTGGGVYTLQQYTSKGGTTVGSPVPLCEELNLATLVPVNAWVHGVREADGVVRFNLPLGC